VLKGNRELKYSKKKKKTRKIFIPPQKGEKENRSFKEQEGMANEKRDRGPTSHWAGEKGVKARAKNLAVPPLKKNFKNAERIPPNKNGGGGAMAIRKRADPLF